jgi:hypothetical protein
LSGSSESTLWLFNIAIFIDGPFIDCLPIKNGGSFHGYVSHNQSVPAAIAVLCKSSCLVLSRGVPTTQECWMAWPWGSDGIHPSVGWKNMAGWWPVCTWWF